MALSFADATGNLFNRLGRLGKILSQMRSYQTSQLTNFTSTSVGAVAQYNGESDVQALLGGNYIGALNAAGSVGATMRNVAAQTLNRMIFRDNPRISQTLQALNTSASLAELIRQMKAAGVSVRQQTVAASVGSWSGTPDASVNVSVVRAADGLTLQNLFAEALLLTCTADSYLNGLGAGNETITITGTGAQNDHFAFDWPLGSDANTTVSVIDGNSDNSAGNLLVNSGFEEFTGNVPDNWTLSVGTAGTHVFEEGTVTFDGGGALRITGDGSTLVSLKQTFDSATGTTDELDALTQYSANLWLRRDGLAPAAGRLVLELVDDGGTVLQDPLPTDNSLTIDLTGLSTTYVAYKVAFRTPHAMPASYAIRLRMPSGHALSNGRSVYVDKLSLGQMTRVGTDSPYIAVHAGAVPLRVGDNCSVTVTNGRGSGGTLDTWQTLFYRLFPDFASRGLILPYSSVPTISDNLITS